jgi:hypothetical protein
MKFFADVTGLTFKPTENGLLFFGQQKDTSMALALEHTTTNFQELSGYSGHKTLLSTLKTTYCVRA